MAVIILPRLQDFALARPPLQTPQWPGPSQHRPPDTLDTASRVMRFAGDVVQNPAVDLLATGLDSITQPQSYDEQRQAAVDSMLDSYQPGAGQVAPVQVPGAAVGTPPAPAATGPAPVPPWQGTRNAEGIPTIPPSAYGPQAQQPQGPKPVPQIVPAPVRPENYAPPAAAGGATGPQTHPEVRQAAEKTALRELLTRLRGYGADDAKLAAVVADMQKQGVDPFAALSAMMEKPGVMPEEFSGRDVQWLAMQVHEARRQALASGDPDEMYQSELTYSKALAALDEATLDPATGLQDVVAGGPRSRAKAELAKAWALADKGFDPLLGDKRKLLQERTRTEASRGDDWRDPSRTDVRNALAEQRRAHIKNPAEREAALRAMNAQTAQRRSAAGLNVAKTETERMKPIMDWQDLTYKWADLGRKMEALKAKGGAKDDPRAMVLYKKSLEMRTKLGAVEGDAAAGGVAPKGTDLRVKGLATRQAAKVAGSEAERAALQKMYEEAAAEYYALTGETLDPTEPPAVGPPNVQDEFEEDEDPFD